MAHKTNYKDALFEQRKYRMQNNPDGTVTPIDETDYTQEGDRVGALELNEIGEALNALEQEMGKRELQTYTALSQLSLEAPVTLSQLITAMPDGSYAAIGCNGTSVVSDIPSGSAAGSLEVVKVGDSGSAKYTNTSNGQVYFWGNGQWYAALVDEMVLGTMEEIDANTDAGKVAGALAVKELSSERNIFSRSFNYTELVYGSQNFSSGFVIIAKVNRVVIANVDVYFKIGLTPGVAHQILSKSQLVDINCWIPTPTGNQSFAFESIAISGVNKNLAIIGLNGSDNAANGLTIYPLDVPTGVGDHIRHQLIWVSE